MKFFSLSLIALAFLSPFSLRAELPVVDDSPEAPNLRLAWKLDADGGVSGDEWNGFEVAYGSKVYPLDQMLISYSFASRDNTDSHDIVLALEEYYPLSKNIVPYGIAGVGIRFIDIPDEESGDTRGWFGKLGAGLMVRGTDHFSLFGELSYHVGDRELWQDDDGADSQNVVALLGVRYHY